MAAVDGAGEALHQETLADFILVRTDQVDEGERLRPVDPVWAGALGRMMARDGQDTPVQVCRLPGRDRWTLVVGAHRLAGAKREGIPLIKAEVVTAERDARRLREVRENLWRSDLAPIDRAAFIAEAVAIQKRRAGIDPARDGRVASAAVRWQKQVKEEAADATITMMGAYGFNDQIAAELGLSRPTIERDLMLFRRLSPAVIDQLRADRHPILSNATQLRALAKQEFAAQTRIAARLIEGEAKSVADALARPRYAPPKVADPEAKRLSAFLDAFNRMALTEKKAALAELLQQLTPGLKGDLAQSLGELMPAPATTVYDADRREQALLALDSALDVVSGLIEDAVLPDERGDDLTHVEAELQLARHTLGGGAA